MNMLRKFAGISVACFALLSACGGGKDGNGPGGTCDGSTPWVYQITGYSTSLARYDNPLDPVVSQVAKPLGVNESPAWNAFSIELKATYQKYQASRLPALHFSLFAQAYACSPNLSGKQKVTNISITSANDFSDKYPAGSELVLLFESIHHSYIKLPSLLVNAGAPLQLSLKLLEAPQFARQNFEVQISLDDGSVYMLKTGDVYFALP